MYRFLFAVCLVVFIIGFGLQIRDYRRKPEQDKTMALVGLTLTALSFALIVAGNLLG